MPEERRRFNIGHEIAHTFFPDCAESVQLRGGGSFRADDQVVETLCDVGAAEMLFPLDFFLPDVAALGGPSLATLVELRGRYVASWEATGNRLVSTATVPCAMVVLRLRLKSIEERQRTYLPGLAPRPKLRVDYSVRSNSLEDHFVPPH
jgi:Zn-dependent peptidase ImmA (M78 family)